jgi:F420H(2)-dependent quinone reductase
LKLHQRLYERSGGRVGHGMIEVQVARNAAPGTARVLEPGDEDYDRLWKLVNEKNHGRYDAYQAGTSRPIPLVVVSPG